MKIVAPNRATRAYTQTLVAPPEAVFPLLCPVREADITCSHTSLGTQGDEFIASFAEDFYRRFMQEWESRINDYLRHGAAT